MDGSKSSDDVLCYKDAVQFVKFSKRKLSSTNVHKTRRRFARDEVYRKKVIDGLEKVKAKKVLTAQPSVKQEENDSVNAGLPYKDAVQYLRLLATAVTSKNVLRIQRRFRKDIVFRTKVINKLGSAEEAPVDVSSAKEAVVHNAAVDLKILF